MLSAGFFHATLCKIRAKRCRRPDIETADQYRALGFVAQACPLADTSILPALLADEPVFTSALASLRAEGRNAVPYLETDAIRRVAQDSAIVSVVETILGTQDLVMWGANIRRSTPNQASAWHVDLESLLWPTVTVGIGLEGCTQESATWCLPGTHRLRQAPPLTDAEVLSHGEPEQIAGFGDGYFYTFDARVWHRGDPTTSQERVMLFIHYQRASAPRIPMMEDYILQTFSTDAAPFFTLATQEGLSTGVAKIPWWYRWQRWTSRIRA
nr:phytanoyl-CoA dioxygenase family protein [Granulicella aggregans]